MTLTLEQYREELLQDVLRRAEVDGIFSEQAFLNIVGEILEETGQIESLVPTESYVSPNGRVRVDGFDEGFIEKNGRLSLLIVNFVPESDAGSLSRTEMNKVFDRAKSFVAKSLDHTLLSELPPTSPAYDLAETIVTYWAHAIDSLEIILVTNKRLSQRVDTLKSTTAADKEVVHSVWDLNRLYQFQASGQEREDVEINLIDEFGSGLRALKASTSGSEVEAYLAVIPGDWLARIYGRWRDRLLEQNVRVFLQTKTKVNRGISATLSNEPGMFFSYNNGISSTAESIQTHIGTEGMEIVSIRNLQIVNGAQTTASVFQASKSSKNDLAPVSVQMKISIVPQESQTEIVPRISQSANSQNAVSAADFFANHPFHVRIEQASRRIWAPSHSGSTRASKWFYERARGQYDSQRANLTAAKRREVDLEYPRSQRFTKTDLAKFDTVWMLKPQLVSRGAQKNFAEYATYISKRWESSSDEFNDDLYKELVAKAIVFRSTEALVSKSSWYLGGYRANIVAYGIAKLAYEIFQMPMKVDFVKIWNQQAVTPTFRTALVICCEAAQEVILNPRTGHRNASEWAKRDECWQALKSMQITLPGGISVDLVDLEAANQRRKESISLGKIDSGILDQKRVLEAGAVLWQQVCDWGKQNQMLSPKDLQILRYATDIPSRIPSEKQSQYLLSLAARLTEAGCTITRKI